MSRRKPDVFSKVVEDYERTADNKAYFEWCAVPDEDLEADAAPYSDDDQLEYRRLIQRRKLSPILNHLTPIQREVLNRRFQGQREVDIAAELGMGQSGVAMSYKRLKERLKVLFHLPNIQWEEWERIITPFVAISVKDQTVARQARIEHRVQVLYTLYCTSSYRQTCETETVSRGVLRGYAYQLRDTLAQADSAVSDNYSRIWCLLLDNLGCRANATTKTRPNGRQTRQEAQCG